MHAHIDALRIDGDVIREDSAAEAAEDPRHDRSDLAGADESHRAAVHVEPEEASSAKLPSRTLACAR